MRPLAEITEKAGIAKMPPSQALIGGEWFDTREMLTVEAPAYAEPIARIARSEPNDVDAAVGAARQAFEGSSGDWPSWRCSTRCLPVC